MPAPRHQPARSPSAEQWADWRWQTRHRIRSLSGLERALGRVGRGGFPEPSPVYPVGVTPYYLSLVDPSDPDDPILRQILPVEQERRSQGQETADPFDEARLSPLPGVIHRYPDRVLVVPTNFCATLCRHCFRKRTWADGFFMLSDRQLRQAVEYVREHEEVRDVLVTGGRSAASAVALPAEPATGLRAVPQVEVLRVASRTPVTLPQRIDKEIVRALAAVRPLWFLTHFNHVREVTAEAGRALRLLLDRGITVQNQAVLLRGVNDSTSGQVALSRALLKLGVRPYYLHLADPVAGAGHFRLPVERGLEIVRGMFGRISGLGIPRLVVDLPGGKGKVPLVPDFTVRREGDQIWFESPIDGAPVPFQNPTSQR
ncbi:MAG: KamA family radical SAM protein [Planctomycetota bacterium]